MVGTSKDALAIWRGILGVCLALMASHAISAIRDLPAPSQINLTTFSGTAVSKDATKAGVMERMANYLDQVAVRRSLTSFEARRLQEYRTESRALHEQYGGNKATHSYREFMFRAAVMRQESGDNYIVKLSPQLVTELNIQAPGYRKPSVPPRRKTSQEIDSQMRTIAMSTVLFIVFLIFVYWYRRRPVSRAKLDKAALAEFGQTRAQRRDNIEAFFNEPLNTVYFAVDDNWPRIRCGMERNLLTMDSLEKEALKACYLMANENAFTGKNNFYLVRFALVWGNQKGQLLGPRKGSYIDGNTWGIDALSAFAKSNKITSEGALSVLLREFSHALKRDPDNPVLQSIRNTFVHDNDFYTLFDNADSEEPVYQKGAI